MTDNRRLLIYAFVAVLIAVSWAGACVIWQAAEIGERVAPLPARSYDDLTFVFVGTGTGYEDPERRGPSTAVAIGESMLLVDAGRGVADALRAAVIPVEQPELLLLSSLSPVNTVGIDDLVMTRWLREADEPLRVVGPPGTAAWAEAWNAAQAPALVLGTDGLGLVPEAGVLLGEDAGPGWSLEWNGVKISAGALEAAPLPAVAWKFERLGRGIVVAGTGWDADGLARFAAGVDLLVHEAAYVPPPEGAEEAGILTDPERLRRERALHTSIEEIGAWATQARVRALALVRLRPPPFFPLQVQSVVGDSYSGEVIVPDDGDEWTP